MVVLKLQYVNWLNLNVWCWGVRLKMISVCLSFVWNVFCGSSVTLVYPKHGQLWGFGFMDQFRGQKKSETDSTQLMRRKWACPSAHICQDEFKWTCLVMSHWNSSTGHGIRWKHSRTFMKTRYLKSFFNDLCLRNDFRVERFVVHSLWCVCVFRLKAAEESFRQVKEKATYSIKPKHASGIVRIFLHSSRLMTALMQMFVCILFVCFVSLRKRSWEWRYKRCSFHWHLTRHSHTSASLLSSERWTQEVIFALRVWCHILCDEARWPTKIICSLEILKQYHEKKVSVLFFNTQGRNEEQKKRNCASGFTQ